MNSIEYKERKNAVNTFHVDVFKIDFLIKLLKRKSWQSYVN